MITAEEQLRRIDIARAYPGHEYKRVGFAYYMAGIDDHERFRNPGVILSFMPQLFEAKSIDEAALMAFFDPGRAGIVLHMAVIYPARRNTLVHRHHTGAKVTTANRIWATVFSPFDWIYVGVY